MVTSDDLRPATRASARVPARGTRGASVRTGDEPAPERPVARVVVDVSLAHLDKPFDYLVPARLHDNAIPGCRVKVRFAGRDVSGFLLDRADRSDYSDQPRQDGHVRQLAPLRLVVSPEPVLTPQVLRLARAVTDRYAGTLADVLRLAVPPRHGRVEAAPAAEAPDGPLAEPDQALQEAWAAEVGGPGLLARLGAGEQHRVVWTAHHGSDWPRQLAVAAATTAAAGRGALICLPSGRDVARMDAAMRTVLGPGHHVVLSAELGPAARYRAFLALARGQRRIVVGTRAAAFAPVTDLGLVAIWDDGDDLYEEPRAPYPHAREVLLLRSYHESTAALLGSFTRSVEAQALVESGWAVPLQAPRALVRDSAPRVRVTGQGPAAARDPAGAATRMPHEVFETVRVALERGPVLVHTPRAGYESGLVCDGCHQAARCHTCSGPLLRPGAGDPARCRWCDRPATGWRCPHCRSDRLRPLVVGSARSTAEWGRAFPRVRVIRSDADRLIGSIGPDPVIVIATPGAEPAAADGYAAAILLDTWLTLGRPSFRAAEEALRRWLEITALVRSGNAGGQVLAVGEPDNPVLQALIRADPVGFASRELADRRSAHLTPAARVATLTAAAPVIEEVGSQLTLPPPGEVGSVSLPARTEVLGPVALSEAVSRLVVRAPVDEGGDLSAALHRLQATRSARKLPAVRVQVDPSELI